MLRLNSEGLTKQYQSSTLTRTSFYLKIMFKIGIMICLYACVSLAAFISLANRTNLNPNLKNRQGMYITREEIVKAPVHDHPCQLRETALRIAEPKTLSLGHRGATIMKIQRCIGKCKGEEFMSTCTATRVRGRSVNIMVKSYRTGVPLEEELKNMILDEHLECGCECNSEKARTCLYRFNTAICQCECPDWMFGAKKSVCGKHFWDSRTCKCGHNSPNPIEYFDGKKSNRKNPQDEEGLIVWCLIVPVLVVITVLCLGILHCKTSVDKVQNVDRKMENIK